MASSLPASCFHFSPSQDSTAVVAAPGHCPALCGWVGTGMRGGVRLGLGQSPTPRPTPGLALPSECKIEHCEACFSHNFCTKCQESLYLHKGRCYPACPEGSAPADGTMECSSPGKGQGLGRRRGGPGGRGPQGECGAEKAHDHHALSFSGDFYALWTIRMPLAWG